MLMLNLNSLHVNRCSFVCYFLFLQQIENCYLWWTGWTSQGYLGVNDVIVFAGFMHVLLKQSSKIDAYIHHDFQQTPQHNAVSLSRHPRPAHLLLRSFADWLRSNGPGLEEGMFSGRVMVSIAPYSSDSSNTKFNVWTLCTSCVCVVWSTGVM